MALILKQSFPTAPLEATPVEPAPLETAPIEIIPVESVESVQETEHS